MAASPGSGANSDAFDFNGDGHADLPIGAPGEDVRGAQGGGRAYVLYGASKGPTRDELVLDSGIHGGEPQSLAEFGATVAAGDFDGDGFGDLAVGMPGQTVRSANDGEVQVFHGARGGLQTTETHAVGLQDPPGQKDAAFGYALAVADFDSDGTDDLAVGSPGAEPTGLGLGGTGRVSLFCGGEYGVDSGTSGEFDENTAGISNMNDGADDRFGDALAAGDFNRDGFPDLAIGVPGLEVNNVNHSGAVRVLYGSADGLTTSGSQLWSLASPGITGSPNASPQEDGNFPDRFGAALVSGDFDGDGYVDLAVGAPDRHVIRGSVTVLYGSATGISNRNQYFAQSTRGIPGKERDLQAFGGSLAAGDFDRDGNDDLVVGVPQDTIRSHQKAGSLIVIPGGSSGLRAKRAIRYSQASRGIRGPLQSHGRFGISLQSLNVGKDRSDDLIVGSPFERTKTSARAGAVTILFGQRDSGLAPGRSTRITEDSPGINGTRQPFDQFGHVSSNQRRVDGDGKTK